MDIPFEPHPISIVETGIFLVRVGRGVCTEMARENAAEHVALEVYYPLHRAKLAEVGVL
jgi:hypothetical protein